MAARNTKEPKVDDIPNQGGGLDTLTKISSGLDKTLSNCYQPFEMILVHFTL